MDIKKFNIYNKKRIWAGFLLAQIVLFYLFSKNDFAILWFEKFFEFQKKFHQQLFSKIPFSVGDVFYGILCLLLFYFIVKLIKKNNRDSIFRKLLILLNVLYFLYQLFWGMMYFQTPIIDRLPKHTITNQETKNLAKIFLEKCKTTRTLVKEDSNGIFIISNLNSLENEILKQQKFLPKNISSKFGTEINSFKPSLFEGIMSYTGIFGYYNPFSAEAQYNPELPNSALPFTLAHESAHQLGFAREQEANFIGYLIGKESSNLELRYCTELFALKSLLNALVEEDPQFVKEIINEYSPGMKRDRQAEKLFTKKHEGMLDSFLGFTNDLFLKTNQQEGSVTYSYFVELLIYHESSLKS